MELSEIFCGLITQFFPIHEPVPVTKKNGVATFEKMDFAPNKKMDFAL